jgi:hypothetical protein
VGLIVAPKRPEQMTAPPGYGLVRGGATTIGIVVSTGTTVATIADPELLHGHVLLAVAQELPPRPAPLVCEAGGARIARGDRSAGSRAKESPPRRAGRAKVSFWGLTPRRPARGRIVPQTAKTLSASGRSLPPPLRQRLRTQKSRAIPVSFLLAALFSLLGGKLSYSASDGGAPAHASICIIANGLAVLNSEDGRLIVFLARMKAGTRCDMSGLDHCPTRKEELTTFSLQAPGCPQLKPGGGPFARLDPSLPHPFGPCALQGCHGGPDPGGYAGQADKKARDDHAGPVH